MISLRPYQTEAVQSIYDYYGSGNSGNCLIVLPTGAGKSLTMAAFIQGAIKQYPTTRIILLTHVKELIEQDAQAIIRYWPEAPIGIWSAGVGQKVKAQITVAGIQSIHSLPAKFGGTDIVIIDESHLVSKKPDTMYGRFLAGLLHYNPSLKVIGFTATPYRMDSGLLIDGDERIFTDIAYEAHVGQLIKDGYLCPLVAKNGATKADLAGVHTRGGEFVPAELQAAMDKDELIQGALDEVATYAHDRNHILGFCAGVEHAAHCAAAARSRGWTADFVTGDMSAGERESKIGAFKSGRIRFLFNAMLLTTGFDAPHIDCILMLRPTKSTGLYCLDDETEILTSNGWKGIGNVAVGDCVPAMDMESGKGKWVSVLSYIERDLDSDETFVEYEAPRANFRVTDNHRMIYKTSRSYDWKIEEAWKMAAYKDSVYVPTAIEIDQPGVPLTDNELYFIGIMMTDGTWTAFKAEISQSERHPEIIDRIEKCLDGCGLAWNKRKVKAKTVFNERYPRWVYSISAGKPKIGREGSGFRHLMPYLDKDFAAPLMSLSKRQFLVLIQGINDGDGFKVEKSPGVDWTPRSWTICSARKTAVDRLQALAAIHGFTGHLRKEHGSRKNPIYILTITPQAWRSIGGTGKRPQVRVVEPSSIERVWCVETQTGTIITRRRGKVTVMGNCQILGRGLRKHHTKENTLVLDFAGNVERHGPIDQIRIKKKREGKGEGVSVAPVKECPSCHELLHPSVMLCPGCGHEWQAAAPHGTEAADAVIVAALEHPRVYVVDSVEYSKHEKNGKAPSLKVTYWCGPSCFNEWVPIEDPRSFVKKHAVQWFWQRGAMCPDTVDAALEMIPKIPAPDRISVKPDGKYWRVLHAEMGSRRLDVSTARKPSFLEVAF